MASVFGVLANRHGVGAKSVSIIGKTASFNDVVSGVTDRRIKVLGWILVSGGNADNTVSWVDGSTAHTGLMECGPTHVCIAPVSEIGWFTLAAGAGLDLDIAGTSPNVDGVVVYIEVL